MKKIKAYVRTAANTQKVKLTDVPIPEFREDEVLIKVAAFGVGIHDRYFIPNDVDFPYPIGSEGAGIIKETGSQVSDFSKGDRVVFTTALQPQGGTWAEYAVANKSTLIRIPDELSFQKAAAAPIAGKTALESMRELDLQEGETLFVAGASGAIGTLIIQLAKSKGVKIAASASTKNHDYMKSLGAEKTVDYKDSNWIEEVKTWSNDGVSKALAIQPRTGQESLQTIKDKGLLITVSGDAAEVNSERGITVQQMEHQYFTTKELSELLIRIAHNEIKVVLENEYPFEKALEALEKTETRHARGKSVVVF